MTLREAYEQWGQQSHTKTLCIKTRNLFRNAWKYLDYDMPCRELTLQTLAKAMRKAKPFRDDAAKAASVMVHVLAYANRQEPEGQPQPNFSYNDIISQAADESEQKLPEIAQKLPESEQKLPELEQKQPDMEQKKRAKTQPKVPFDGEQDTLGRSKNRACRQVAQIDPHTLKVVRIWRSMGAAESGLGIQNVTRAIQKRRCAGGFYWCDEKDVATFQPAEDGRGKNGIATTRVTIEDAATMPEPPHNKPTPDPEAVDEEQKAEDQPTETKTPTLDDFTDKALIEEICRRGWHGEVGLKENGMTVKFEF